MTFLNINISTYLSFYTPGSCRNVGLEKTQISERLPGAHETLPPMSVAETAKSSLKVLSQHAPTLEINLASFCFKLCLFPPFTKWNDLLFALGIIIPSSRK